MKPTRLVPLAPLALLVPLALMGLPPAAEAQRPASVCQTPQGPCFHPPLPIGALCFCGRTQGVIVR